jgi:AcrR family transcriptional regulator
VVSCLEMGETERRYHHGDLRRQLLTAALQIVSERGLEGWSLRGAALRAGVSHAAPYHHFGSKAALLDELSNESWALLAERLAAIPRSGSPLERVQRMAVGYVRFALENRERFRVMLHRGLAGTPESAQAPTALVVFRVLEAAVAEAQDAGVARPGDLAPLVLTSWATMHGFAALVVAGPLADQAPPGLAEPLAGVVAETLSHGLGPT